jgi:hypothetical protein
MAAAPCTERYCITLQCLSLTIEEVIPAPEQPFGDGQQGTIDAISSGSTRLVDALRER